MQNFYLYFVAKLNSTIEYKTKYLINFVSSKIRLIKIWQDRNILQKTSHNI